VRLKLPDQLSETFKVEFRVLELQNKVSDNISINIYLILLTRSILYFNPELLIPISLVDQNINRAHVQSAYLNQKFYSKRFNISDLIEQSSNNINIEINYGNFPAIGNSQSIEEQSL